MKKNIWDNVYYRLKDPVEIKLAVLYTIRYADMPLTDIELKHLMLTATTVDFMDLCSVIAQMLEDRQIKTVWRDESDKYDLTQTGEEMLEMFEDKIMASVRTGLRNTIDEYFAREKEKAQVRCDIVPAGKDTYSLEIELKEGKTALLMLSLFAGGRQKAIEMRKQFREDPMGIYEKIAALLTLDKNKESQKQED